MEANHDIIEHSDVNAVTSLDGIYGKINGLVICIVVTRAILKLCP